MEIETYLNLPTCHVTELGFSKDFDTMEVYVLYFMEMPCDVCDPVVDSWTRRLARPSTR